MASNTKLFLTLLFLTMTTNSIIMEKLKNSFVSLRKSLFPTSEEILKIDEMDDKTNSFLKKTSKEMIDKKEDGVYLLYNLIYYNFLLNLNKFCLLRYSLKNCNEFHLYANEILTSYIRKEKVEIIDQDVKIEDASQTLERMKVIDQKDYFNIASIYEKIFTLTGEEQFDSFLNTFKTEFEQTDENYHNDAETLLGMYQDNLQTLAAYLQEEKINEEEQMKIIMDMERQSKLERI
jgi:hypothetical protein